MDIGKGGISGSGVAALAGGSILLWAAIAGRQWTGVLKELIGGNQPGKQTDYPITSAPPSSTGDGSTIGTNSVKWDTARASSFNDLLTASGRPMTTDTIASPYLPLGTKITVMYNGKTVSGTVWDFGPADSVMQRDPTRFLDLSTSMMKRLTGNANNLIEVQYQVTHYGNGRIYRPGHAATAALRTKWGNIK